MTTPFSTLQTSSNLEKFRRMAKLYNACSKSEVQLGQTKDWAKELIEESRSACEFQEEMVSLLGSSGGFDTEVIGSN